MERFVRVFLACSLVIASLRVPFACAQTVHIDWQPMTLAATIAGGPYSLDAMLLYPQDGARHPLVVVSHGSPRNAQDRATMAPTAFASQMLWFVRRGFTVAAVMRRGYGRSQGPWGEGYGSCAHPDYADAGLAGAADITGAIGALARNPHVDTARVVAVGVSAGAFATVALTTNPPPGLAGAIVFAPGRGSLSADHVCAQDALVAAFAHYGKTSRVPMLWISASNDHFFGPELVKASLGAFDGAGGKATFFAAPAYGADGHALFDGAGGIAIWEPPVTAFLSQHDLGTPPVAVTGPPVTPPARLGPKGRDAFAQYLLDPPHKAFAMTPAGRYGFALGSPSAADASQKATRLCAQQHCAVVNVDNAPPR